MSRFRDCSPIRGELLTSRDIVDITNLYRQGYCSRRKPPLALISFGEIDDEDYVNLKNWELEKMLSGLGMGWAWASNNSVLANSGDDLVRLSTRSSSMVNHESVG